MISCTTRIEIDTGESMKAIKTFSLVIATSILLGLLSGCTASGTSLEGAVSDCRTPGQNTWINAIDATIRGGELVFQQVELDDEQSLDPRPSCVLEKLSAPAEVFEEIKASSAGEDFFRDWGTGSVAWTHTLYDEKNVFDVYIAKK